MDVTQSRSDNPHDAFASDYDQQVLAYGWWGHEALFGLCYEFVRPGERLLDVGIGTGLSSALFARTGLQVFGFDSSLAMLKRCQAKHLAADLKQVDLTRIPWPYAAAAFDHVIMCGVLHFVADLGPAVAETARVIRRHGILAFTTKVPPANSQAVSQQIVDGIAVFSHRKSTVEGVMASHGFETLKCLRVPVGADQACADSFYVFVTRKSAN
jgi:predicted TPR repeat methyltransferase